MLGMSITGFNNTRASGIPRQFRFVFGIRGAVRIVGLGRTRERAAAGSVVGDDLARDARSSGFRRGGLTPAGGLAGCTSLGAARLRAGWGGMLSVRKTEAGAGTLELDFRTEAEQLGRSATSRGVGPGTVDQSAPVDEAAEVLRVQTDAD